MKMAWKEIMKYKMRYFILGAIIFLIALLTLIISGLANGLSADNASLIQNMPDGTYYLEEEADENHSFSHISDDFTEEFNTENSDGMLFSIQMGELIDDNDQSYGITYVTADNDNYFPGIQQGEIILDSSLQEDGFEAGDTVTTTGWEGELTISGFADQEKFSHSPVGFINFEDYKAMYQTDDYQIAYTENEGFEYNQYQSFDSHQFLNTIPSYSAEQLSLNMITVFLYVISTLLFAIFFYMINVQKLSTFGILKAIGMKTRSLFIMMWIQMLLITLTSYVLAASVTFLFSVISPDGMPFTITGSMLLMTGILFIVIGFAGVTVSGVQIKRVEPIEAITKGGM